MLPQYVIDFERINELTSHPNDDPSTSGGFSTPFTHSISRKILKEYINIYVGYDSNESQRIGNRTRRISITEYDNIVETLKYNKILVTSADIREKKIDKILEKN